MSASLEFARMSVHTAQVITAMAGSSVGLVVVAGMAEGVSPGFLARVDAWVPKAASWALRTALRLFYVLSLAWVAVWTYRLAVTYLHIPTFRPAGHRYSMVRAWTEGTYDAAHPKETLRNAQAIA